MPQLPGYLEDGNEYQVPTPEKGGGFDLGTEVSGIAGAIKAGAEDFSMEFVDRFALGGQDVPDLPRMSSAEIQERQKADGVTFAVPKYGMTQFQYDYTAQKARETKDAEERASNASAIGRGIGYFIGGGLLDPTVVANVPGLEEKAAKILMMTGKISSRAGRIAARTAIRAGQGAIEGAAGAALMAPVTASGRERMGKEYGLDEFAADIGMSAAGGAVLRGGIINPIQEARWRRQGKSVYAEIAKDAGIPREAEVPAEPIPEERRTGAQAVQEARAADAPTVERPDVREAAVDAADDWRKAWSDGLAPEERAKFLDADGRLNDAGKVAVRDAAAVRVLGDQNLSRLVDLGDDASDALIEGAAMASGRIDAAPVPRQTVEAIADVLARSREEGVPVARLADVDERVRAMASEVQRLGDAPQSIAAVLGRFGDLARGMETADDAGEAFLDAIATAWNDASSGAKLERLGEDGEESVVRAAIDGMVNDRAVSLDAQVDAAIGVGDHAAARAEAVRNASPESRPFAADEAKTEKAADEYQQKAIKEPETPDEARRQAEEEVTRADKDLADLEEEIRRLEDTQGKASVDPGTLPKEGNISRDQVVESVRTTLGDKGAAWIEDGRAEVMTLEELRKIAPDAPADAMGVDIQMPDGTRKIALVSDRLGGMNAGRVLLHEIFHFQRDNILGAKGWADLREQVQQSMRAVLDAEGRGEVLTGDLLAWKEARKAVPSDTGERLRASQRAELMDEETVAYLIENAPQSKFVQGIIEKVRAWLFQQGFSVKLTEGDLRALAVSMMRRPVEVQGRAGARFSTSLPDRLEVDGVSRATTNSAGRPLAQDEEGVRNFWKWFGDSKVVDADGKPLVVYHGTAGDFNEFSFDELGKTTGTISAKKGFFFSENPYDSASYILPAMVQKKGYIDIGGINPFIKSAEADEFVSRYRAIDGIEKAASARALEALPKINRLSIQNADPVSFAQKIDDALPIKIGLRREPHEFGGENIFLGRIPVGRTSPRASGQGFVFDSFLDNYDKLRNGLTGFYIQEARPDLAKLMQVYLKAESPKILDSKIRKIRIGESATRRKGTDATNFLNVNDPIPSNHWIVYDPTQIKSATGNRGTFDPTNPDIRYSRTVTPRTLREGLRDAVDKLDRAEKLWPVALAKMGEFDLKSFDANDAMAAGIERMAIDRMMATDKAITAEDATALLSAWMSTGGDADKAAEKLLMAQGEIVRCNALGARKTAANFRDIIGAWKPNEIAEALIAKDDASMYLRTRSRLGVAQMQKGFETVYSVFFSKKLGEFRAYAEGYDARGKKMPDEVRRARDLEIFTALREGIIPDGPNPNGISDASLRVADAIRSTFNLMRRRGHDLGEVLGELEDWGLTQSHDKNKLQNAAATVSGSKIASGVIRAAIQRKRGKFAKLGSAENFEAWAAFAVPHLDLDRMGIRVDPSKPIAQWTKKARRALESIYEGAAGLKRRSDEFGVATRDDVPGEIDDPRGVLEAFERMQARRVIHFKDAASAFAYNEMFGASDLFGGVQSIIAKNARSHGMRYVYGASPEAARGRLIDMLREHAGLEGRANFFTKRAAWKMNVIHNEVTGRLNDPVNAVLSRVASNGRIISSMSKLAKTVTTQLLDVIPASIHNAFRFRGNHLSGSLQMLGRVIKDFDSKEQRIALDNLLLGHESDVGDVLRDQRGDVGSTARWHFDMTMRLQGMNYLDRKNVRTVANRIAHGFGEAVSEPGTMANTDRLLNAYGFDGPEDMRALREATTTIDGKRFLSPEGIVNVSREALDGYAAKRGLIPDEAADDLELMVQTLISSEISMARMVPTARTKGLMKFGTRPGSFLGEVARSGGQFKSYPVEYMRRVWVEWPDALGGSNLLNMPLSGKMRAASYIATMIAGGLTVLQLKALISFKKFLPVLEDDATDDKAFKLFDIPLVNDQTLIRAINQGGVFGVYLDQVLGPDATEPAKAVMEGILGPTLGSAVSVALSALNTVKSYDPDAENFDKAVATVNADLIRSAKGWTPYVGHWATCAAMDRLIWWKLQEMASPGWAEQFEKRTNMKGSIPYMGMRPQFEVLGKRVDPEIPEWFGKAFMATPTEAVR